MPLSGIVLTPQGLQPARIEFDSRIEALKPISQPPQRYILPGFVDLHVHGGGGADVMEGEAATRQMARFHARHGTTALLATTVTAPAGDIEAALRGIRAVMDHPGPGEAQVLGVHLEGPFVNPNKLGAQPPFAIAPDLGLLKHWMGLAVFKVITLAPELEGAGAMIRHLVQHGVRPQMGHTLADYAQAKAAFEAGAIGFTHFYNAMSNLQGREPGVVGLALGESEWAELIGDGLHVHPGAIRAAMRAIPNLYGVTDAVAAAGMPEGEYRLGRHTVYKKPQGVFLADGTLAGSALTMDQALRNLVGWGLSLAEASRRLSELPARYIGLSDCGFIKVGKQADLVVINAALEVEEVWVKGELVAGS
jgi:N-acetylglucosamine-6-phosphate deacetylase